MRQQSGLKERVVQKLDGNFAGVYVTGGGLAQSREGKGGLEEESCRTGIYGSICLDKIYVLIREIDCGILQ